LLVYSLPPTAARVPEVQAESLGAVLPWRLSAPTRAHVLAAQISAW
jgi:hypothetical protein